MRLLGPAVALSPLRVRQGAQRKETGDRVAAEFVSGRDGNGMIGDASFQMAISAIERALQERDRSTCTHSYRVAHYADAIARALRLGKAERREIGLGAMLHDIGKIGVPDQVLRKPGALSAYELAQVRAHPVIGERILRPLLVGHPTALAIVRSHHEHIDGSGYPDRLTGEEIPLAARVVGVADTFDALTSPRPYRVARSATQAVAELKRVAGTQLDARAVGAFVRVLADNPRLLSDRTAGGPSRRSRDPNDRATRGFEQPPSRNKRHRAWYGTGRGLLQTEPQVPLQQRLSTTRDLAPKMPALDAEVALGRPRERARAERKWFRTTGRRP